MFWGPAWVLPTQRRPNFRAPSRPCSLRTAKRVGSDESGELGRGRPGVEPGDGKVEKK